MNAENFEIRTIGRRSVPSPILRLLSDEGQRVHFVDDDERILLDDRLGAAGEAPASLELAGPRRLVHFEAPRTCVGIVTCGGLCPGLNDVIRGLTMEAWHGYGVRRIFGFRYGFAGIVASNGHEPMALNPEVVSDIHEDGGTILGTSRGPQEPASMLRDLCDLGVNVLFVIGGDGTTRGALAIAEAAMKHRVSLAVIGVPKTIDNDIALIDRSFGFETAYAMAVEAIRGVHMEARAALNGVGVVKVMGRHSGFIAAHATLATSHVNFTLVPESPFAFEGESGLLEALRRRLERRRHAVIVVAEGAGQDLLEADAAQRDASGNVRLDDIGQALVHRVERHFAALRTPVSIKYVDPSYMLRSVPASPQDKVYCWRLAQNAVHAAMAGRTAMVVGLYHGRFVHIPMAAVIASRKQIDPFGDLWLSVLESTGQPARLL